MRTVFVLAMFAMPSVATAQSYQRCLDSCKMNYDRERYNCNNYLGDATRYNACLSAAERNYQSCQGRCK